MKLFFAVCLGMVFAPDLFHISFTGQALKCNLCVSGGILHRCIPSVQTCPPNIKTCGNVKFNVSLMNSPSFRSCMKRSFCWKFIQMASVSAVCCTTDLCN